MLDVLELKIGLITLLLIFTFQPGLSVSGRYDPEAEYPRFASPGRSQAQVINSKFDVVFLYRFAYEKHLYGSSPAKEAISELYFQETDCKKGDMKNINKTKACDFNPKGKIIICQVRKNTRDGNSTDCKSTGDKYDIPKSDRRSEDYAIVAVNAYNDKPESPLRLTNDVNVMSALKREVSIGTKNVLQFSATQLNCTKSRLANGMVNSKCFRVKPRLDCEATVNEPMTTYSASELKFLENKTKPVLEFKRNVDVKCQKNKSPDDAIDMKNMPPPEEETCMRIHFNLIGKRGWAIHGCRRWTDEQKPDDEPDDDLEKTAGSSMEDQKLVKPKAGSAVVESSADKEGNNKTSGTMSSGSVPKKASTSKLKAKNNLTKAKPKTTAMKMREAESKQADQTEEDVAFASTDKGQLPIPPIIPKKVIKKEKAVTKAPGRQNTTKTKNKEKASELHTEEDSEEEAKFEKKKPTGKASKASAKKANDGGKIVSGGKEKVKVPPQPERSLEGKEDKKSNSKPKKGAAGSTGKWKATAEKEKGKNQRKKEEKENEDEKKHPDDEDKIIKVSEPKLNKAKPGKKGSAASNKKGEKAK